MKYMGSKRAMLTNGLGALIQREAPKARRFVDLFSGSAAVSIHVAARYEMPVLANDLQAYSAALAKGVLLRQGKLNWGVSWSAWMKRATVYASKVAAPKYVQITPQSVSDLREWCCRQADLPITRAYGGHYFSPEQAVWIDALRATLMAREPHRATGLASLIQAVSQCAAAPGHTAQPFQPTSTAKRFIEEAWIKDIVSRTRDAFRYTSALFARIPGTANIADANDAASSLQAGDLAFIDPPYSGVHYSRFYHVLETVCLGTCGEVTGRGRYPARELRPRSKYSVASEAEEALDDLLKKVSSRGARAVLTFPDHECSNGLSGKSVKEVAAEHFRVSFQHVDSHFSTLGGNGNLEGGRAARHKRKELMLVLEPK